MTHEVCFTLALVALAARGAFAQARVLSAPPEPSLLNITRQWSRASSLGDLRDLQTGSGHLELRVWGGFGLTTRTQGVVLRRAVGRWSAFLAQIVRCEIQVPKEVGDTASRVTMQSYTAEARRHCGTPLKDIGPGVRIITSDTVVVERLSVPDSMIESAWRAAVRAGAFQLPGRVDRNRAMDDGFAYVVELLSGGDYRASAIEHVEPPETEADQQIRRVYDAVSRVLKPEQQLKPEAAR